MPPKQVYGKRVGARAGGVSFAEFIGEAGDGDSGIGGGGKKSRRAVKQVDESVGEKKKSRRALEAGDANKATPTLVKGEMEMEVIDLTERLEALGMGENGGMRGAKGRARKVAQKAGKEETEVIDLTGGLDALTIGETDDRSRIEEAPKLKGKPRKAAQSPAKASVTKTKSDTTAQEQTSKRKQNTNQQTAPATPVCGRKLKCVEIPKRASSPSMSLPTPDPTPQPEDPYAAYVAPLLSLSSEKRIISFKEWSAEFEPHFSVSKIAEASFSEVYRLSGANAESVLKLVALRSPPNITGRNESRSRGTRNMDAQAKKEMEAQEEEEEWKSHVNDVHSEVKLLQNLNYIPGFTNFREVVVLQGRPSSAFVTAWKAWNKSQPRGKKSEFPDPSKKASYDDAQLWAVIEMQDAGTDVEKVMDKGGLSTIWEVWDVFWGVCLSVAKAEEACRFEHRDLHLENICIRSSRSEAEEDLITPFVRDPLRRKLGFTGLETTVIDYTLSRADVSTSPASRRPSSISHTSTASASSSSAPSTEPEVAFLDLNKDMGLFAGDASEEYQYEIYRYMRGAVLYNDPLKRDDTHTHPQPPPTSESDADAPRRSPRKTPQHIRFDDDDADPPPHLSPPNNKPTIPAPPPPNIWKSFHPKTNLLWAHFILDKLLQHLSFSSSNPTTLPAKLIMRNVEARIEDQHKVARKACKLFAVLERVAGVLEPGRLGEEEEGLGSVKELVVWAMEERWVGVGDVVGC